MLPHQGVVAAMIAGGSLILTLGILTFSLRREKKFQASNPQDEH